MFIQSLASQMQHAHAQSSASCGPTGIKWARGGAWKTPACQACRGVAEGLAPPWGPSVVRASMWWRPKVRGEQEDLRVREVRRGLGRPQVRAPGEHSAEGLPSGPPEDTPLPPSSPACCVPGLRPRPRLATCAVLQGKQRAQTRLHGEHVSRSYTGHRTHCRPFRWAREVESGRTGHCSQLGGD